MPTEAVRKNKLTRHALVRSGLCGFCRKPRNKLKWLCDDCGQEHREKQRIAREARQRARRRVATAAATPPAQGDTRQPTARRLNACKACKPAAASKATAPPRIVAAPIPFDVRPMPSQQIQQFTDLRGYPANQQVGEILQGHADLGAQICLFLEEHSPRCRCRYCASIDDSQALKLALDDLARAMIKTARTIMERMPPYQKATP